MRLLKIHGVGDARLDSYERPPAGPKDVVIRMKACGICGSDLSYIKIGGIPAPGTITALFSASACRLGEGRVPAASGARFWIIRRRNGKSCCDACSARASSPLPFWPCASHSRLHPSLRCLFAAALIARMEPSVALALPPPGAAVRSRRRCACLIAALVLNGKHFEKNR